MKPLSFVGIELTNACNYRCVNCPHDSGHMTRKIGMMDLELFKDAVEQSYELTNNINISFFGEQLLHPKFLECLDYLKSRPGGINFVMNSNLSQATKGIFRKFIDIRMDELRISIDAATAETYSIVRSGTSFVDLDGNKIKKADRFESLCGKMRWWFGLSNHVRTRHVYTVSSKNIHEVKKYIEMWKPHLGGDDHILAKSVLTYGGKMSDKNVEKHRCNVWDAKSVTIDWQGNVTPCNLDTNMDMIIGSLLKNKLKDLVSSPKYIETMGLSQKRKITPCDTCIDSNNWSKNIMVHKGTVGWEEQIKKCYGDSE